MKSEQREGAQAQDPQGVVSFFLVREGPARRHQRDLRRTESQEDKFFIFFLGGEGCVFFQMHLVKFALKVSNLTRLCPFLDIFRKNLLFCWVLVLFWEKVNRTRVFESELQMETWDRCAWKRRGEVQVS